MTQTTATTPEPAATKVPPRQQKAKLLHAISALLTMEARDAEAGAGPNLLRIKVISEMFDAASSDAQSSKDALPETTLPRLQNGSAPDSGTSPRSKDDVSPAAPSDLKPGAETSAVPGTAATQTQTPRPVPFGMRIVRGAPQPTSAPKQGRQNGHQLLKQLRDIGNGGNALDIDAPWDIIRTEATPLERPLPFRAAPGPQPVSRVHFNQRQRNVNLVVRIQGTVTLPDDRPAGLPAELPVTRHRTYTLISDGTARASHVPLVGAGGHRFSVPLHDLTSADLFPESNLQTLAQTLARTGRHLTHLKARRAVLNAFTAASETEATYTPEQAAYLAEYGISGGNYSPKPVTRNAPAPATEVAVKITGHSRTEKPSEVLKRLVSGQRQTVPGQLMLTQLLDVAELIGRDPRQGDLFTAPLSPLEAAALEDDAASVEATIQDTNFTQTLALYAYLAGHPQAQVTVPEHHATITVTPGETPQNTETNTTAALNA